MPREGIIYVLLPVHERRAITEQFVGCLLAQEDQGFHLVLVDDGSTDGTADRVLELLPTATVLRGDGTWWWAGSLEQARRWLEARRPSEADLVLIANDDTLFGPGFLAGGRRASGRRRLVLARLYKQGSDSLIEVGARVDWRGLRFRRVQDPERANCFSTRGLFLPARAFVRLGGFHVRLLPHYLSDYEFTIRARRRGFALDSSPEVKLWYNPATTGIRRPSRRTVRDYLAQTITTRSASNPFYWTTFVLLASPRRQLPRNVLIVWLRFVRGLLEAARPGHA